jgi:magnesium-transporting ATPase (P-type)
MRKVESNIPALNTKKSASQSSPSLKGTAAVEGRADADGAHAGDQPCRWDICQPQKMHIAEAEDVLADYQTTIHGLSPAQVEQRLQKAGPNQPVRLERINLLAAFTGNFTHLMAWLLWVGGALALLAQMPPVALAVWMVNIINGCFSFFQEYKAERATEALLKLIPNWVIVLRDGVEEKVSAERLVPGDIINLSAGDRVPADARVVQQASLSVDESVLTGESKTRWKYVAPVSPDVKFQNATNILFAGTSITGGTARAVVVATGGGTVFGRIARLATGVAEDLSPLQKEMKRLTRQITAIAVSVGTIMFVLACGLAQVSVSQAFVFAIGMIVAFVPEGMVPTVTLSLAIAVERMARQNALVKQLSSVETLGCTSVICTDKTGTLTEGKMTVHSVWMPGGRWYVSGRGHELEGDFRAHDGESDAELQELLRAGCLCNNAKVALDQSTGRVDVFGDSIEAGLLIAAIKYGIEHEKLRESCRRIVELPFDSMRKRMSTVNEVEGRLFAYVKGAPQELLRRCDYVLQTGQQQELSDSIRCLVGEQVDEMCREGFRVLGIARRYLPDAEQQYSIGFVEQKLEFLGLVAFLDPPRAEVKAAIDECHRAGIRVVMLTGDHGLTAEAIARHVDIVEKPTDIIVTGEDLERMGERELLAVLSQEVIFARVTPQDKLRVVQAFQKLGHVVAVTGDGVNDAPSLKQADIGIAMGCRGTDVARAAADMILLDDNFATIVKAIEMGRAVYGNIRKFAIYVLTSNVAEAVPFALMLFSRGLIPLPLNIMQVLAVDLGTDMIPAVALGADSPQPGLMQSKPRSLKEPLLDKLVLLKAFCWFGALEALAAVSCYFYANWTFGFPAAPLAALGTDAYKTATASTFIGIVAAQVAVVLCCHFDRQPFVFRNLFANKLLWAGIAFELLLCAAIVNVPSMQAVFGTKPVPLSVVAFAAAMAVVVGVLDEMRKAFLRRADLKAQNP